MSGWLIETENLCKDYSLGGQKVHALRGVGVTIPRGQFVAVMGPSGSGKSTLMNLLGCLDTPTSGRYLLDGRDVSGLSREERAGIRNQKVGFVFQNFSLLPRTTALDNAALPLMYRRIPRRERLRKAEEVLIGVGLHDRMHHLPSQLSGGQQQRVAIARATVNDPALILADEPTGALDTRTGLEIMAFFQWLNQGGQTVVVVTHDPDIARFSQRILRFRDGRLVGDEAVAEPDRAAELLKKLPAETGEGAA